MNDISLASLSGQPIRLHPLFQERVWGTKNLQPYFAEPADMPKGATVGEVWFTYRDNRTSIGKTLGELLLSYPALLGTAADLRHPGICPLLVKLLFTTERLSVQVHPDDEYAAKHHQSLGKTEAWYVVNSDPPGEVAIGFREEITPERLTDAAQTGEIEDLLDWRRVSKGDVVFAPAGTVHAIGAGLTICEIQENSDITYRLYDYGRPRELHLEHGTTVSHLGPHTHEAQTRNLGQGRHELLACDYFRMEKLTPNRALQIAGDAFYKLLICTAGAGTFQNEECRAGDAFFLAADGPTFRLDGPGSEWILTYASANPADSISEA